MSWSSPQFVAIALSCTSFSGVLGLQALQAARFGTNPCVGALQRSID